jgi:hypothetical protein
VRFDYPTSFEVPTVSGNGRCANRSGCQSTMLGASSFQSLVVMTCQCLCKLKRQARCRAGRTARQRQVGATLRGWSGVAWGATCWIDTSGGFPIRAFETRHSQSAGDFRWVTSDTD